MQRVSEGETKFLVRLVLERVTLGAPYESETDGLWDDVSPTQYYADHLPPAHLPEDGS